MYALILDKHHGEIFTPKYLNNKTLLKILTNENIFNCLFYGNFYYKSYDGKEKTFENCVIVDLKDEYKVFAHVLNYSYIKVYNIKQIFGNVNTNSFIDTNINCILL